MHALQRISLSKCWMKSNEFEIDGRLGAWMMIKRVCKTQVKSSNGIFSVWNCLNGNINKKNRHTTGNEKSLMINK